MKKSPKSQHKTERPISLAEVAARAGVAVSTVSRVVNRSSLVAEKKRREIEAIIKEIGYKPAPIEKRKGVRKNPWPWIRHQLFKVILFGPHDLFWITNYAPVYSYVLHGIEEYLNSLDFQRAMERAESRDQLLQILKKGGADGFLILNTGHEPLPEEIREFPTVVFMGLHELLSCDKVMPDPVGAGILAAEYLCSKKCELAISIGGVQPMYRKRSGAFCSFLKDKGLSAVEILHDQIVRGGTRMHKANYEVISAELEPLLAKTKKVVGIFSVTDIITPVLYSSLSSLGWNVGRDVFVVSCNNERPFLDPLHPAPAVIDTQAEFIGRRAVQQMMRRLESPDDPRETVQVEPRLILPEEEQ